MTQTTLRLDSPYSVANLRLDAGNMRYRGLLLEAAEDYAVPAAIIATVITAEATMRPAGASITWDEFSRNDLGSAAGLAQFTRSSWFAHAVRSDGMLNAEAVRRGYVDANGAILREEELLDLRFDTRISIRMTAEMIRRNWDHFAARKLSPEALGEGALAKVIYLAHHEGAEGAYRYLIGSRPAVSRERFESNVPSPLWSGNESAKARSRIYYTWLEGYIDRRIDVRRFMVESKDVAVPRLAHLGHRRPMHLFRCWLRRRRSQVAALRRNFRG